VRLWNPTRADPACDRDTQSSSSSWGRLPSALPMQTYADGHVHPVHSVVTDRSSTALLLASDRTLLATDLITTQTIRKWWGHAARIEYATCLGGGGGDVDDSCGGGVGGGAGEEIHASASYDSTVRLWDARSRSQEPLMILDEAKDAVTCVAASRGRNEAQIATSSVDGKVCVSCHRIPSFIATIFSDFLIRTNALFFMSCFVRCARCCDECHKR
jgi:mitogen-activated protein kinase organizer 1